MIVASTHSYGEGAIYVDVHGDDEDTVWRATHRLAERVRNLPDVLNVVPTYSTAFIEFDLARTDRQSVQSSVDALISDDADHMLDALESRRFKIPVVYGGDRGEDLPALSRTLGMSEQDIAMAHSRRPLRIRCLAGPVGGPMMAGPDLQQPVPRQKSPRAFVKSGAVLLAGRQSFLKTMAGPGGWQIIGHTPLKLIDLTADPLVPWVPGDEIQFIPIEESEWTAWEGARPHAD